MMQLRPPLLTPNPSYSEACNIIDDSPDAFWFPILEIVCRSHQLPTGGWIRIREGGNVLFKLNKSLVIKLVPPNWAYQGTAEIEAWRLLKRKLSIPIPEVIVNGTIDNWPYVVMTMALSLSTWIYTSGI